MLFFLKSQPSLLTQHESLALGADYLFWDFCTLPAEYENWILLLNYISNGKNHFSEINLDLQSNFLQLIMKSFH